MDRTPQQRGNFIEKEIEHLQKKAVEISNNEERKHGKFGIHKTLKASGTDGNYE